MNAIGGWVRAVSARAAQRRRRGTSHHGNDDVADDDAPGSAPAHGDCQHGSVVGVNGIGEWRICRPGVEDVLVYCVRRSFGTGEWV